MLQLARVQDSFKHFCYLSRETESSDRLGIGIISSARIEAHLVQRRSTRIIALEVGDGASQRDEKWHYSSVFKKLPVKYSNLA